MRENPLVGVWKLVAWDVIRTNGVRVPIFGKQPIGRLYYDAAGNMSVHIMKAGREQFAGGTRAGATDGETRSAFEGYEAYFSTYVVDAERQTISHNVLGSLFPDWTGSIQRRFYAFDSMGRLVLSTEPIGSQPVNGNLVELVWERLS
jgi:hypothetical protein